MQSARRRGGGRTAKGIARVDDRLRGNAERDSPGTRCWIRRLCGVEAVGRRGCWGLTSWTCNPRGATAARPHASTPYDKNDRTGRRPARTSTAQLGEDYRCAGGVEEPGRGRSPRSLASGRDRARRPDRDRKDRASPHPSRPGGLDPGEAQAQPAPVEAVDVDDVVDDLTYRPGRASQTALGRRRLHAKCDLT